MSSSLSLDLVRDNVEGRPSAARGSSYHHSAGVAQVRANLNRRIQLAGARLRRDPAFVPATAGGSVLCNEQEDEGERSTEHRHEVASIFVGVGPEKGEVGFRG